MNNHMFDPAEDTVGCEGSNVIYLGDDKNSLHRFISVTTGTIFTGYELRLQVQGYSKKRDPDLEHFIFVERYTPLIPSCLKSNLPSKTKKP